MCGRCNYGCRESRSLALTAAAASAASGGFGFRAAGRGTRLGGRFGSRLGFFWHGFTWGDKEMMGAECGAACVGWATGWSGGTDWKAET